MHRSGLTPPAVLPAGVAEAGGGVAPAPRHCSRAEHQGGDGGASRGVPSRLAAAAAAAGVCMEGVPTSLQGLRGAAARPLAQLCAQTQPLQLACWGRPPAKTQRRCISRRSPSHLQKVARGQGGGSPCPRPFDVRPPPPLPPAAPHLVQGPQAALQILGLDLRRPADIRFDLDRQAGGEVVSMSVTEVGGWPGWEGRRPGNADQLLTRV